MKAAPHAAGMSIPPAARSCAVTDDEIAAGLAAERYINGLIRGPAGPTAPRTLQRSIEAGERRLARFRRFLHRLGNPQRGLRIVHVGGTSGKGSVAVKVAAGLTAAGLRTGLHCTPYLQTPLEKFECGGRLARPFDLADLAAWVRPHVDAFAADDPDGPPTYGMVWVALTFEYFRRAQVAAAVLEVGAGGRYDLTNVVQPVLAVVTSVGPDHLKSLGGSLDAVAWHKAGIFKPGAAAMCGPMSSQARQRLQQAAAAAGQPLREIDLPGADFRVRNTRLAHAVLRELRLPDLRVTAAVRAAAAQAELPGRFERLPGPRLVYLDGAHNRDKARALAALIDAAPLPRPRVGVIGVVGYRSPSAVLAELLPGLDAWVAAEPQVYGKPPLPADALAAAGAALGRPPLTLAPDPAAAMRAALQAAGGSGAVVSAGSLYLVGNLRRAWYPTEAVMRRRTMWPPHSPTPAIPANAEIQTTRAAP